MEKKTKSVHLFNCDQLFDLDSVESLFTSEVTSKLSFNISIQKHYFNISQMSEMSESTVPSLQIDFAVFVVHAQESRLSINEDNAGIGYAKIYRALQQATDDNVIIVIGGDDNYKDDEEENRVVLSRWSKRKISSQFNDEYLDGRKSFVFSWNKQHRKIHEEALLHYFDPAKKGEKFEPKLDKVEFVDEVEIPSNNEQNPVAAGLADKDSAAATAGPEETHPRPQGEGKEDPKGQTGSTGDPNIMEPSRNEQVPSAEVVTRGNSWWSSLRKYCTIL